MAITNTLFGQSELSFGPANIFWDTATGGDNVDLGGVDQLTITKAVTKIELREAQAGDRPADRAVSAQTYQLSFGMSRATAQRLSEVVQGFTTDLDTTGNIIRCYLADVVGQRDSSIWKQLTVYEILDGVQADPATQPGHVWDFFRAAPMSESTELVYDAATQRFYGVVFETYKSDIQDVNGNFLYAASRVDTT